MMMMSTDGQAADKEEESGSCIKFSPPMSVQRYQRVISVLTEPRYENKLKRVVDFGCSELLFFKYLKNVKGVEEISVVDVDSETLETKKHRAAPLATDFIIRRTEPLTASVYHGSITDNDDRIRNYDAVICIELIEHLHDDVLNEVPDAIFGFIRPKVAVITTPNSDFNVLFPTLKVFRHWDHKFEWSRKEFNDWCSKIVGKYPCYTFTTHGIGRGPSGRDDLGCCSQMAVFRLSDHLYRDIDGEATSPCQPYKLIERYEHPFKKETKPTEEEILGELQYYLRCVLGVNDLCDDESLDVPLTHLLRIPKIKIYCSLDSIRDTLKAAGWQVVSKANVDYVRCFPPTTDPEEFYD